MSLRRVIGRWSQRRSCVILAVLIVTCLGILCITTFIQALLSHVALCSHTESRRILQKLCLDYNQNWVSGNMCPDLCILNNVHLIKCLNFRGGKQVYLVKHRDIHLVMKAWKADSRDYNPIYYRDENTGSTRFPSVEDFVKMASDSVIFDLSIDTVIHGEQLVRKLWPVDVIEYIKFNKASPLKHAAMQSLWSLLQQDEYTMLRYLHLDQIESHLFPKMYGTCGHFYFLEYAPPGKLLDFTMAKLVRLNQEPTWTEKAQLAINILDLLSDVKTKFVEEMHMCDIKGLNFGVDRNGSLKMIDMDSVFFDSKMKSEMKSGDKDQCQSHDDCDYFDCQGWCNMATHTCLSERINNNFQTVCWKIFGNHGSNMFNGLLNGGPPDITSELEEIVSRCGSPEPPVDRPLPGCPFNDAGRPDCADLTSYGRKFKGSEEDFEKLHHLLQQSLHHK